ncbi:hydrolase, partial [Streptomyces sp. JJ36]|nr:hydrolase [Streptomyces sp. JJ36]
RTAPSADGSGHGPELTAARAAGGADAAALLLERAARVADDPDAGALEQARNPADCALAVEQLVDVVELLFRRSSSTGQLAEHPLQRIWRDVHCLAGHVALRFDSAAAGYGSRLLEPGDG